MATIYEVSKLAGVSLATVSRVMNDPDKVSEKTRKKVIAAMKQLDYRPNTIAQSLASNRSNCVGVLVSELHGPIFGTMVSSIEEELRRAGKFTIFTAGHSDAATERQGIEFLTGRKCDALILHVEALHNEFFIERKDRLLPFVLINRFATGLEDNCISLNNELGGYQATRMLLDLGHREIAYISGPLDWGDAKARLVGHQRALAEERIDFDDDLLVESDYHETGGGQAMKRLLKLGRPITAVVCANDEMAVGAMEVIRNSGRSIPDDISVVGFDNVRWSKFLYPKLTTVNNPVAEMSRMAARWVLKNVYRSPRVELQYLFHPSLIARDSAAAPPDRQDPAPATAVAG
ncbi:MAG: LacI family DNA-binding transcriptional regulator [Xanthomonadales bacterium]|nr:LacI family DNA-binding transcriptional regulator [Xanthomonadales bacterium]